MLHLFFPTPDRFAKAFISLLKKHGVNVLSYDPSEFKIVSDKRTYILFNFYAEFTSLSLLQRAKYLPRLVKSQAADLPATPKTWAEASPFILPTIKHQSTFDYLFHRAELDSGKRTSFTGPVIPIGSRLRQVLCFDYPDMMAYSMEYDSRKEHNVSTQDAWKQATDNLWARSKEDWRPLMPGPSHLWSSPWQDNQDPSRLALPGLIRQLKVKGEYLAITVHRDMLFVTGTQEPEAIRAALALAVNQLEQPRADRAAMLLLTQQDTWVDFEPHPDHPAFAEIVDWNHLARATDYHSTYDLTLRVWKHRGHDIPLLPVQILTDSKTNRHFTVAPWDITNPGLLPQASLVAFFKDNDLLGFAPWPRVIKHAEGLLEPITDLGLPYWRTTAFPSSETLAKMRACPDTPLGDLLHQAAQDA